ncbi:M20/M25/M40 family metallo-hydrolase [Candidatus Saccharibacteria bacterium]|nr:M20/M25/M40 family metallo-hydrolase [Candidatus Saccharibacteria bacterium]
MSKTEVDYLEELIAFKTVTGDRNESKKCAQYCANFFKSLGLRTQIVEYSGYPNVVATTQDTKKPKILLQAHMDVVPAKDELFKLDKTNDKLSGRGAFDMKFACASYFRVLERLSKPANKYDFGIMLSFDEEIGGTNGVKALLDDGYSCKICILPDSGKDWHIETSAKGAWFVELVKKGKNAHASEPHTGINSAEILNSALNELLELRQKYDTSDLTLTLTKFTSGEAMNQVPDHAEAILDIRYRNKETLSKIEAQLSEVAEKHGLHTDTKMLGACMDVDRRDKSVCEFVDIAQRVLGREIEEGHSSGSTDGRYFCDKGIPCIVLQPNGEGRHSDNEWVDRKGVEDLTEMILQYIEKYAIID